MLLFVLFELFSHILNFMKNSSGSVYMSTDDNMQNINLSYLCLYIYIYIYIFTNVLLIKYNFI